MGLKMIKGHVFEIFIGIIILAAISINTKAWNRWHTVVVLHADENRHTTFSHFLLKRCLLSP